MNMVYIYYLLIMAVVVIAAYTVMRAVDYGFGKKEAQNDFVRTKAEDEIRYEIRYGYAKRCIQSFNDGQKQMALSLIKQLNDGIMDMYQRMEDQ